MLLMFVLLPLIFRLAITSAQPTSAPNGTTFTPRCGDCWCIPKGGTDQGTCPSFSPGIYESIPASWAISYQSFQLDTAKSEQPVLEDANGNTDCYPFAGTASNITGYAESKNPPCVKPTKTSDSNVCAYRYETKQCKGRTYNMNTYNSSEQALAEGAHVVHSGPCGVCSNANDLAVRMKTLDFIDSFTAGCGVDYYLYRDFGKLVTCIQQANFTTPCATLWAHFTAANAFKCSTQCFAQIGNGGQSQPYNAGPPFCNLSSCLACSSQFEADFNDLAGINKSPYNAGIVDKIAYPCSDFFRVDSLDPCIDTSPTASPVQGNPQASTSDGSRYTLTSLGSVASAMAALVINL